MTDTTDARHAKPQSKTSGPPIVHMMELNRFGKYPDGAETAWMSHFRLCNDSLGGACAANLRPREGTLAPQVLSAVHAPRDVAIDMRVLSAARTAHVVWTRARILSLAAVPNPLRPPGFLIIPPIFHQFSLNKGDSAHG